MQITMDMVRRRRRRPNSRVPTAVDPTQAELELDAVTALGRRARGENVAFPAVPIKRYGSMWTGDPYPVTQPVFRTFVRVEPLLGDESPVQFAERTYTEVRYDRDYVVEGRLVWPSRLLGTFAHSMAQQVRRRVRRQAERDLRKLAKKEAV
jgi:hypothetical protein